MAKVETFIVKIEVPKGATISDVKDYIRDAVGSWGGGYDATYHPMFGCHEVTVTRSKNHA